MKKKNLLMTAIAIFGLATVTFGQTVPSYVPTTGLVGWWPFTGNANDMSGNGYDGTVTGATLASDRFGNSNAAYTYNGTTNYISTTAVESNITTYTISAWFKSSVGGYMVTSGFNSGGVVTYLHNQSTGGTNNGKVTYYQENNGGAFGSLTQATFIDNQWHHFVGVLNGFATGNLHPDSMKIYIDGVFVANDNATTTNGSFPANPNMPILFGGTPSLSTSFFNGELDDIGIWNRALTQQEITALYTGCTTCPAPTNFAVASITGSKATISWTGNSCAAKYRVRYRVQGTTTWTTKIVTAPVSTKTLTLLQPLTTYEYQVRTDCNSTGTIASAYSGIQTFTTICDCIKPTNLSVSNLTQTTATVSWVGNACAVKYRLQYRVQGTTTWTTKTATAPIVTKTLTGLTANTIYEYRLRTDCNLTGSVNSGWTTITTITTLLKLEEAEINSSAFYVSPNPCSTCFVNGNMNEQDLIVTDIIGRKVNVQFTKSENGFYINMPDASNGLYLIRNIRTGDVVKFLKN